MKTNNTSRPHGRRRVSKGLAAGLMLSALAGGGGILASGLTANPATAATATTSGSTTSGSTASGSTTSGSTTPSPSDTSAATFPGLPLSGTVTAVGASTVTIGTTIYTVSSTSDIDKNGESTLSSLAVGDAVTFSTVTSGSVTSIDKLHAGNETLDRPTGSGTPPTGAAGASSSAGAAA
jgi:hypothetical protein